MQLIGRNTGEHAAFSCSPGSQGQLPVGSLALVGIRTLGRRVTRTSTNATSPELNGTSVQSIGTLCLSLTRATPVLPRRTQGLTVPERSSKLTNYWRSCHCCRLCLGSWPRPLRSRSRRWSTHHSSPVTVPIAKHLSNDAPQWLSRVRPGDVPIRLAQLCQDSRGG